MYKKYLQKYSNDWEKEFFLESEKIKTLLCSKIKDIQHIGSTSIPGMMAKPIIDMSVLVNSINDISFFVEKLKFLDYIYQPEMSSVERIFFRKGDPTKYHLSITCSKHSFWSRQILFRNYLRKYPKFVEEYNTLKLNNIKITPKEDFDDLSRSKIYNQGKGDFVAKILKLAEKEKLVNNNFRSDK